MTTPFGDNTLVCGGLSLRGKRCLVGLGRFSGDQPIERTMHPDCSGIDAQLHRARHEWFGACLLDRLQNRLVFIKGHHELLGDLA